MKNMIKLFAVAIALGSAQIASACDTCDAHNKDKAAKKECAAGCKKKCCAGKKKECAAGCEKKCCKGKKKAAAE